MGILCIWLRSVDVFPGLCTHHMVFSVTAQCYDYLQLLAILKFQGQGIY